MFNILAPFFGLLLFILATQYFVVLDLNTPFWLVAVSLTLLTIYSKVTRADAVQYYCVFMVYYGLLGYLIQSLIGVRFLNDSSMSARFDLLSATLIVTNSVGIFIGAELFRVFRKPHLCNSHTEKATPVSPSSGVVPSLVLALALCVGAGILLFGSDSFFGTRLERYVGGEALNAIQLFVFQVLKILPYMVIIALISRLSAGLNSGIADKLGVSCLFLVAILISNPVNTARFVSLTALTLVLFSYLISSGRKSYVPTLLALMPIAIVILMPATSLLRGGLGGFTLLGVTEIFSSLEFSSFQMLIFGSRAQFADAGSYVLSGLFVFVPRAIWPGKMGSLGEAVTEQSGFLYLNSAVPSFFAAYVDLGIIGLWVFSVLSGLILRWASLPRHLNWFRRKNFYKFAVFALVPIFMRGDFSTFMISFYAVLVAYEIVRLTSRLSWSSCFRYRREKPAI